MTESSEDEAVPALSGAARCECDGLATAHLLGQCPFSSGSRSNMSRSGCSMPPSRLIDPRYLEVVRHLANDPACEAGAEAIVAKGARSGPASLK